MLLVKSSRRSRDKVVIHALSTVVSLVLILPPNCLAQAADVGAPQFERIPPSLDPSPPSSEPIKLHDDPNYVGPQNTENLGHPANQNASTVDGTAQSINLAE